MDIKKTERRSMLKCAESKLSSRSTASGNISAKSKRRISFSGRKSVREFHTEEKPKSWNDSYEMPDHISSLENISTVNKAENVLIFESSKNVESRYPLGENQKNFTFSRLAGKPICSFRKSRSLTNSGNENAHHDTGVIICERDISKDSIASKPLPSEITYYGNDNILMDDDRSSNDDRNTLSVLQSIEMDITNDGEYVNGTFTNKKIMNAENNEAKTQESFSNQLISITYESMNCNNKSVWDIEKNNKTVGETPIDNAVPMDLCTDTSDSFKCAELFKYVSCSNTMALNTTGQQKTHETTIFEFEECKDIISAKKMRIPKVISKKNYTPSKNIRIMPKKKDNLQQVCEDSVDTRSDVNCFNADSLSNIGLNTNLKSPQSNLSSSFSYSSPLFPPIKCKKLNLRQLNAEIGDGNIVVFPNKIVESHDSCFEPNINITFNDNNNKISISPYNLSNREVERIDDIPVASNLKGLYDVDIKQHETYYDCDMLSDNTSLLFKEKVDDDTSLGSTLIFCDDYIRDTIPSNSEIGTFMVETDVKYVTRDLSNGTISNLDLTSNHSSINTNASDLKNAFSRKYNEEFNTISRSIYEIQDMSLNKTNIDMTNVLSKSFKLKTSEINDNFSLLDITPQNSLNQRKTIYFDQDIDSVSVLATGPLESKRNYGKMGKVQNIVEVTDSSSDSFVLNLKEARAALSSNCKRQIEGTPHRSFLEFVYLEREVEQTQIYTATNAIEVVQNEPKQTLVTNEMIIQIRNHLKEDEKNSEREQKCFDTKENQKFCRNNSTNTITENNSCRKVKEVLGKQEKTLHEFGNRNESDLRNVNNANSLVFSPILKSVANKRSTADLTPNLPLSKKKQSTIFSDCTMDESAIFCNNETLKQVNNSSIENPDILKEKNSESNCIDAYVKILNISTYNESDEIAPVTDDITVKFNLVNEAQNMNRMTENNIYQASTCNQQMDCLGMISLQSHIHIISNNDVSKKNKPDEMDCSVDTIQLPRRDITFHDKKKSIIKIGVNNASDKSALAPGDFKNFEYVFEDYDNDNPITITDVSAQYFAKQNYCIVDKIGDTQAYGLGDSNKTAVFTKEFINLERENSPLCISEMDDIEETHLSLVETLLSEDTEDIYEGCEPYEKEPKDELNYNAMESCSVLLRKESIIDTITNGEKTSLCRRCKGCQKVISSESMLTTTESFALPSMALLPCLGFEGLLRLRKRPKLKDVHEYWRRSSLGKKEENVSAVDEQSFESEDKINSECSKIKHVKDFEDSIDDLKRIGKQMNELNKVETDIFFKNLTRMFGEVLPNWTLNYQMMARRIIQLTHIHFFSFSIELLYEDRDQLGNQISTQDIYLHKGRVPSKLWKPIDHLLHFNFSIILPLDLKSLYSGNTNEIFIMGLLQRVDGVCTNVFKDALNLWRLLCNLQTVLIRESNRVIIRKVTREVVYEVVDDCPIVQNTEFQIELNNIRTLSFKNIIYPPLYDFCEKLQLLPSGIDFLKIFLKSPSSYLRS